MLSSKIDPTPFNSETDVDDLLQILKTRLPKSCSIYNMANALKRSPLCSDGPAFYSLKPNETATRNDLWIVGTYYREDYGTRYSISVPEEIQVTEFIQNAFSNSKLFDWTQRHDFPCLDSKLSRLIWEISVFSKGNSVKTMPVKIYYMSIQDASDLELTTEYPENVELRGTDVDSGTDFFVSTWKYRMPNSEVAIRKFLERNNWAGVYVNGEMVCGTNVNGCGLIGMLHSLQDHRNSGYASLATRSLAKSQALIGAFPTSAVQVNNIPSHQFQIKNGFTFSHYAYFITHIP